MSSQKLLSKAIWFKSYALQVTMEISNSENLLRNWTQRIVLELFENYVDGISADNNAEFEFLRIKRNQSVQCWAQALP